LHPQKKRKNYMLSVTGLTLHFGGRTLFEDITFLVNKTDRIGLTGKNGAGKSTLLKAMVGQMRVDGGSVSMPKECKVLYLSQDLKSISTKNVLEETKSAFDEILQLQNDVIRIQKELETREDYESDAYMNLIDELTDKDTRVHMMGAQNIEEDVQKILKGLGFEPEDFAKSMNELSGGWQMRVELAKMLLQKPDVILLDEPTNHLDIESIQWLEKYLIDYPGAVILVSHDITFLDNVTNRTIEIVNSRIEDYKANYSTYLELRKERRENIGNAAKNQQDQIKQLERNIERFRAKANKASFAQSLIKKLDKMDIIEVEDDDVKSMRIKFNQAEASGRQIVKGDNVSKTYGDKPVLKGFSFDVQRGDRIAFVGKNGMGKTTLAKAIVRELEDYNGKIEYGHNVKLGYFAQHQAKEMNNDRTVFQTIDDAAIGDMRSAVRSLLGAFLFSGEDVEKKVKVLSGGERGRLSLCKLLLEPVNFLVLDEPTNHLDIRSKEVLKNALNNFSGTVLLVSHDRDFLKGLTNITYEFTTDGIKEHIGDIDEFLRRKQADNFRAFESEKEGQIPKKVVVQAPKISDVDAKAQKNKISAVEKRISDLEDKIKVCETDMLDPNKYQDLINDSTYLAKYNSMKSDLEKAMEEWESLM
jgi:ATP-binding cassette, subfamily F, member 3